MRSKTDKEPVLKKLKNKEKLGETNGVAQKKWSR